LAYNLLVKNEAPSKSKERFESLMIVVLPILAIAIGTIRTGSIGAGIWVSLLPMFGIALVMIVAASMIKNKLHCRIVYLTISALILLRVYFSLQELSG